MVEFEDGTTQYARVTFTNPKAQSVSYDGQFYLAAASDLTTPVNNPTLKSFLIPAGASKAVDFDVAIPLLAVAQADYVACLKILVGGQPVVTFFGSEGVRVTYTPAIDWGDIVWNP